MEEFNKLPLEERRETVKALTWDMATKEGVPHVVALCATVRQDAWQSHCAVDFLPRCFPFCRPFRAKSSSAFHYRRSRANFHSVTQVRKRWPLKKAAVTLFSRAVMHILTLFGCRVCSHALLALAFAHAFPLPLRNKPFPGDSFSWFSGSHHPLKCPLRLFRSARLLLSLNCIPRPSATPESPLAGKQARRPARLVRCRATQGTCRLRATVL